MVGVIVFVGVTVAVGVGVGENAGVQKEQSNKLPLSIESNMFVANPKVSVLYSTHTGFPSMIALNIALVLNGTGLETK